MIGNKHTSLEILLGAVLLGLAIIFGFSLWQDKGSFFKSGQKLQLYAKFTDSATIDVGTAVKLAGTKIGQVVDKQLDVKDYRALVTLNIENNIKIPNDSILVVGSSGLLGGSEMRVELGQATEFLKSGESFQKTQSQPSLEDMIGRAIFVLNAIGAGTTSDSNNANIKK